MIINSQIKLISPQGNRSYVVEEHTTDDGQVYRVEGLRSNELDFEDEMANRVSEIEADLAKEVEEHQKQELAESAQGKIDVYIKTINLQSIGLTEAEVEVVNKLKTVRLKIKD
jgi:hypothetical protein